MISLLSILPAAGLALAAPADEAVCHAPLGSDRLLEETTGRVLLLGETHGTEQAPQFADALVCLALLRGESVVLGLEQSSYEQERIDIYLASNGSEAAQQALFEASPFWNSRFKDGRSSLAMLDLLEQERTRMSAGADLKVMALDFGPTDADLVDIDFRRDRAMLRNALSEQSQADRVIVLVGGIHARRIAAQFGERRIETIGSLAGEGEVVSVRTLYGRGESWNCRGDAEGNVDCGVHERSSSPYDGEPRLISRDEYAGEEAFDYFADAYDYFVYLGSVTASLPAVPLPDVEN